jgi:ketosteroid isomerase-like protein
MRVLGLLGVAVIVASGCRGETAGVSADAVQMEIRQVLQHRMDALERGDVEAYSALFAEHLVYVDDEGKRMDKAALVKEVRGNPVHGRHIQSDVLVHSYGNVAVASYHHSVVGLGRAGLHGEVEMTETYVKEKGQWVLAAMQETPIPFANHPAAQVNPALYDEYAGDYQIAPDQIVTISREGNKLYEKWSHDQSKVESVPLSQTAFVQRGEAGVLTFERDSTGKVARLVLHLNNDDLVGAKIR